MLFFSFHWYSREIFYLSSLNQQVLQKLKKNILEHLRTFLEQAYHNKIDDGKSMTARIVKAFQKASVWQFLDGKYDSIIFWDSE